MMRQNADGDYLVAAATDESGRTLSVPLSFLPKGSWTATVSTDAPDADFRTNREPTRSETLDVTSKSVLTLPLAPGGGACVLIKKK